MKHEILINNEGRLMDSARTDEKMLQVGRRQEEGKMWGYGGCGERRGGEGRDEDCGCGGGGKEGDGLCLIGSWEMGGIRGWEMGEKWGVEVISKVEGFRRRMGPGVSSLYLTASFSHLNLRPR